MAPRGGKPLPGAPPSVLTHGQPVSRYGRYTTYPATTRVNATHTTVFPTLPPTSIRQPPAGPRPVHTACRSLARWAFDDAGLFRLELGHRVNNPASCGVARGAAGFAVEGLERQKLEYDGVRFDVELHARLATDAHPDHI